MSDPNKLTEIEFIMSVRAEEDAITKLREAGATSEEIVGCSVWLGRVVEAGTADDGRCRVLIETEPAQLRRLEQLPLYQDVLIRLTRPNAEAERP